MCLSTDLQDTLEFEPHSDLGFNYRDSMLGEIWLCKPSIIHMSRYRKGTGEENASLSRSLTQDSWARLRRLAPTRVNGGTTSGWGNEKGGPGAALRIL